MPILEHFLDRMETLPEVATLLRDIAGLSDNLVITDLRGGGTAALLALAVRRTRRPLLIVTSSLERAESLTDGLSFFGADPLIFPGFETLPFETQEPVLHIIAARWQALARLMTAPSDMPPLIVAPIDALVFRLPPVDRLRALMLEIGWGQTLPTDTLAARLVAMGYRREALVESPGEFAIRGSIVDCYPPDAEWPWRLDLFGDEIDQIRRFDPATQRSLPVEKETERIRILPAACHAPNLDALARGETLTSFFDLLPAGTLIAVDGPHRVEQRAQHFGDLAERHWTDVQRPRPADQEHEAVSTFAQGHVAADAWLLAPRALRSAMGQYQRLDLMAPGSDFEEDAVAAAGSRCYSAPTQSFEAIPAQFNEYLGLIRQRLRRNHWVVIVCDNNGQISRMDELLRENEIFARPLVTRDGDPLTNPAELAGLPRTGMDACPEVLLTIGPLHEGFHSPEAGMLIVTDREIFGRYKRRHIYRKATRVKGLANPNEIERGDFAVHMLHGIGRFEGIRRQFLDGRNAEFFELTYLDGDKLLVPVEKLHLVQKYAGADGKEPALDKLGSKKWQKRCKKSMEAVRKMAGELLELYARRAASEGRSFGPDTTWQREFEASFIYQETPDQLKAIEAVKQDMINLRPMDRLVCGDVGYGKTEVAIRAAFKALVEGRQVAFLAPTTLLVQQHYNNFRERFADYPFKVGMLSRFVTVAQTGDVLEGLASGEIGMVIGTHRLLSKDVRFLDLGLLIVDEEQRFGVAQKEKIKNLRAEVDILTLSATPIPRTLYMALSGLRDLSVITTPPADRLPIKTRTIRMDRESLEEAILRELNRGGQVYVIHNRVQSIHEMAETIHEIVPTARIAVGHGQMDERALEKIMMEFISGKYDILISTTIIENGIDIPNVNTIIINRADTFGLSQLYQLRGRVGRDVRQAYAYLILPPGQAITPAAIKRLEALEEFTDLGVGFSIAMRDLEIRGTGNILGREQHGAINDIGYEMYCRLLEDAVGDLRGVGPIEPLWPTEIRWPVDQLLPEDYIPIESQRIRFYKDLAAARTMHDIEMLLEELLDRYGQAPEPAINLINATRLKIAGAQWRADTIRLVQLDDGDRTVRIKAPVSATELAVALAERAETGRKAFSRLRRVGDVVILAVRETDDPLADHEVLATAADYLEALGAFEAPRVAVGPSPHYVPGS